eukprot:TRINITY_DN2244_c0_g1_i10.p1 TRINITY_DN2244_c0_g1~~TRINITY_DN2244_c0_g1_i10.p1  ORF type:complete len:334 (+),score=90.18 TRINITY_DN2244_c0_g1_i10:185-1186(+)
MEACCDERGAAPEDPDDHKRRMLRLAEEALQRAEDEQAKEVGYVVVNSSEDTDPLPENPGDSGGRVAKMLRQRTFFVNHGVSIEDNLSRRGFRSYNIHTVDDWRGRVQKATGANFVSVPTADGRTLDAFYVQARGGGIDNKACAILFHANAMISLDMALWAKWYSVRGIAALAITMGGYAESSYIPTSELTTYFDAQAAVEFALAESGLTIDRLLVHGLSIGGALASAAAAANPGLNCTVDQTFVNAHEVAVTCGKEFSSRVPTWLIKASVSSMFREGVADPRLPGYVTDQYNNEAKAATIRGNYLSLIHISEPTRLLSISYAVFCLKKKKKK